MRQLFLCLALCLGFSAAIARDVIPAEERTKPYAAQLPACEDPSVLSTISSRFSSREGGFWASPLTILSFDRVEPVSWRPWGADYIPRRFCSGKVTVSDGRERQIDYAIQEDLGFIGFGWNVDWCVMGLDRNWAYAPECRMARP